MEHQDWNAVVLRKTRAGGAGKKAAQRDDVNSAMRSGAQVETVKKFAAGANRVTGASNAKKLEEETEDFHHKAITQDFKIALLKARQAKNLTQKQLAQLINEKQTVITDYETGRAIPNGQIIAKLNRVLGTILPKIPKKKLVKDASST
ncbi:HTH cro/C1-type domain-containing protein [Plasmodiophora brassicae]|uniref:HTH cro/C1-type domain-containing protein n=1 Tax=Plasmodiophora brassicae TaxID=37360 RepID=A0A0G4J8S1_PLABS|nr:hypothetical protein PBRA_003539 [Plasmodiophora brassicae]SPQ99892.1 unnamed protein product [Plasmodiophora brassicae]